MPLSRSSISICLLVLLAGVSATLVGYSSLYLYLSPNLPSVESLRDVKFQTPLRIYSADNKLIGEIGERRTPINLEQVPPLLIKAFIAAEDDRFYSHNGVDPMGFLRAASHYALGMEGGGGGSTLTMQVAKMSYMEDDEALLLDKSQQNNTFLTYDQSLLYKAVQILLAWKIEQELTKNEILEIYLNQIFLGHRSYGIQAASQVYYGKDVQQLSLAQAAVFAGIQPGPSIFNPISYPERALRRRGYVLRRMLDLGFIDQLQFDQASAEPVDAQLHGPGLDVDAPYVRAMVRIYMEENYGERESQINGYKVYTTIDSKLQVAAQDAVINGLIAYDERWGYRGPEGHLEPVYFELLNKEENEKSEAEDEKLKPHLYPAIIEDDNADNLFTSIANKISGGNEGDQLQSPPLVLDSWMTELDSRPTYGRFRAAAVVKSESKPGTVENEAGETTEAPQHVLEAVLANGNIISIPWENGPSTAKPNLGNGRWGHNPKDTSFLKVGDIIRVRQRRDDSWELVQLPEAQSAFVALDPNNGAIKALVGGFDYFDSPYNRIMQAERQPGSNIKPFLYSFALENGYSPATIINDAPYTKEYDSSLETDWRPSNAGDKYLGPIPLREGFYRSQNMVAVRVLDNLPRREFINSLERFGFDKTKFYDDGLSAALGTQVLRPIDVVTGYAVFANGGYKVEHHYIDHIELESRGTVYQANFPVVCHECEKLQAEVAPEVNEEIDSNRAVDDLEDSPFNDFLVDADIVAAQIETTPELPTNIAPRVLDERIVFLIHNMMQDVIAKGTGRRARALGRSDLAGKTGTTNDNTNAWFSGYNQSIVASAWFGYDQNKPLGAGEEGSRTALPIWIDFMSTALRGVPEKNLEQPPGVVSVRINEKTGLRTHDTHGVFEYFLVENVPDYEDELDVNNPVFDQNQTEPPQEIF